MKLSVIVPVYNMAAENKLQYCMDSLVNQTIPREEYEIIAVDDASTDNSLGILREYETKYSGLVKVIHYDDNRRQGGAKNAGLQVAEGEWVGFVDSDDWVAREFYEKLLKKADETGADVVGCDYSLVTEHTMEVGTPVVNNTDEQTGALDREKHGRLILRPGSMVIKIYKHDIIRQNKLNFPEHIFYEDNCAGSLWSLYFTHFERVNEALYYYYQHDTSTVHHISAEKCEDRMKAAELFYDECRKRGFLDEYYTEIECRFAELFFVNTLFSYMQGVRPRKLSFVKKLRTGMITRFPEFTGNPFLLQNTGEEESKWIGCLMASEGKFFRKYLVVLAVRNLRKKLRRGSNL